MTPREKLVEILLQRDTYHHDLGDLRQPLAEADADYLLSNGVVVPPCKIGSTVYVNCVYGTHKVVTEQQTVVSLKQNIGVDGKSYWKVCVKQVLENGYVEYRDYAEDDFGKVVFSTKEEAERAKDKLIYYQPED